MAFLLTMNPQRLTCCRSSGER